MGNDNSSDKSSPSSKENVYINAVRIALHDGIITEDESKILQGLKESLEISDEVAAKIMGHARKMYGLDTDDAGTGENKDAACDSKWYREIMEKGSSTVEPDNSVSINSDNNDSSFQSSLLTEQPLKKVSISAKPPAPQIQKSQQNTPGPELQVDRNASLKDLLKNGTVLFRNKNFTAAAGIFEIIIRKKPSKEVYSWLGICYTHMGRYREAMACFDRVLKVDPSNNVVIRAKCMLKEKIKESRASSKNDG